MDMTKEEYDRYFIYKDGDLFWRDDAPLHHCALGRVAGKQAGNRNPRGYLGLKLNGERYQVHRIIYIMEKGPIPEGKETDHINRITDDNRIENLRVCTKSENQGNIDKQKIRNGRKVSSKYKGVSWYKRDRQWQAGIKRKNSSLYLGRFDSEEEAARAYDKKATEFFGEFAETNKSLGIF